MCSCQRTLISVFSVTREKICLCCYHFTVGDLGLSLPSVCCKETGPQLCISLVFGILFICTVPCHMTSFFFLFFLSLPIPFSCLYLLVSPVLTPPESEKADSEDRVSLKVCVSIFLLAFETFFLVEKIMSTPPLCLQCTVFISTRRQKERRFTSSTLTWPCTSFCLKRRTTWNYSQ